MGSELKYCLNRVYKEETYTFNGFSVFYDISLLCVSFTIRN